jgi:hypothetical protein
VLFSGPVFFVEGFTTLLGVLFCCCSASDTVCSLASRWLFACFCCQLTQLVPRATVVTPVSHSVTPPTLFSKSKTYSSILGASENVASTNVHMLQSEAVLLPWKDLPRVISS